VTIRDFQTRTTPNAHTAQQCGALGIVCISASHADWKIATEAGTP
jgi:hypothetical protein